MHSRVVRVRCSESSSCCSPRIMKGTAAPVCLSKICAAAQENHRVTRIQLGQKWSAGLENGAEAALRPQLPLLLNRVSGLRSTERRQGIESDEIPMRPRRHQSLVA